MMSWRVLSVVFAAVMSLGLGACGGPGKYDVELTLDPALKGKTVTVDVVGVNNAASLASLDSYEVNNWFAAGDKKRVDTTNKKTFQFAAGQPDVQGFSSSDAAWSDWGSPTELVILAAIPGLGDKKGREDPRRVILKTESGTWEGNKLQISVQQTGLRVLTREKKKD